MKVESYFILPPRQSKDGTDWVVVNVSSSLGLISAWRCGAWRDGWSMPERGVVYQPGLEPSEGFGK